VTRTCGKTGAARIALETRKPVIPMAHWGAHEVMPTYGKGIHLFPRHTMRVTAGPAVDLTDLFDRPIDSPTLKIATERIMVQITDLLEGIRGGHAPAIRHDPKVSGEPDIGNFKRGRR
jgi:1-acyl-sn-glycerol-3-phosphate acyltransferase